MSNELPKEWSLPRLEELFDFVIGGDWGKDPETDDEDFTYAYCIRGTEFRHWDKKRGETKVLRKVKLASLEKRVLKKGDILIEISGGGPEQPVGRTVLIDAKSLEVNPEFPNVCTNFIRLARPSAKLHATYLNYYLKTFYLSGEVTHYQGGSNNLRNLKFNEYCTIPVPLAPLNEQIRIANKLDSLLAKVDAAQTRLEKIPILLKRFRQSVLAAAISGELTKEWRKGFQTTASPILKIQEYKKEWVRYNESHNETARVKKRLKVFSSKNLRSEKLPESWHWCRLEDCVLMIVDCHNKTAPYVDSGIPLIRTSNIRDGRFVWEDLRYVDQETYAYWSKRCPPDSGDIIFTREAPMGEAAIIPEKTKVCLGQRTMLIRPLEDYVLAKYLLISIMEPEFKKRSDDFAVGTGVKHYRVGDVSNLLVPIPSTEEQKEIVRRVESLFVLADSVEKQYIEAKKRTDRLTQSLLAKAFRGELVPQNPNDEPASKLLKRIQAEREQLSADKRKRKVSVKKLKRIIKHDS